MRNKRRTDEEWLSLIQQCRSSGFSDRVWCEQNDILLFCKLNDAPVVTLNDAITV